MREKPRDNGRLQHIVQAIDNVSRFIDGKTIDDFTEDSVLFFAVVKNIEIIGEAVYMLSPEFKEAHPATPWRQITGMRHVLVHGYYLVSSKEVWGVAKNRLQPLRTQIIEYLNEENNS
ncbi:MAG: DUF86 domain-containing protein [Duncaniella sp.]|nr:DUF86 domain-containing protein [Duncaniella sp.]